MAGKPTYRAVLWIAVAIIFSATLVTSLEGLVEPTTGPTEEPTTGPTEEPTTGPTEEPTTGPTGEPSTGPTGEPTTGPTGEPSTGPTGEPTTGPTEEPTTGPTEEPSPEPTTPPNPCDGSSCGQGSTCEARVNQTFVCLCLPGLSYNNDTERCESAKVFPGQLSLTDINYSDAMANKESPEFAKASATITTEIDKTFDDVTGYFRSIVLELLPPTPTRSVKGVSASVEMFFDVNSDMTTKTVTETMRKAVCDKCPLKGSFTEQNLCASGACDAETMKCEGGDGTFNCSCDSNYVSTPLSDRVCIACPSGEKAVENECKKCPFGQSGLNCSEKWQLILVIVGSVLGGLLLISLILLPVVAKKSAKKGGKKDRSEDAPYMSHSPAKAPLGNSAFSSSFAVSANGSGNGVAAVGNTAGQRIPRATANSSWDNRTNLEMTPSNSRQNLMGKSSRLNDDQDNYNPYVRSNSQTRPQSNPYTQNRVQGNPYAQNQGYNNPYYTNDDGRRF